MADRILVWGAGGHGRVVADLARVVGLEVAGFVDRVRPVGDPVSAGARVLYREDDFLEMLRTGDNEVGSIAIALGIGDNRARMKAFAAAPASAALTLVHPTAVVSPSALIGRGSVIFATAVVHADAKIGEGVIVNTGALVEHDCVLDDGAHLSPGAILTGNVRVGAAAWIGAGAVINPGTTIGAGSRVGSGAVVLRDVPAGSTVVGVPARPILRSGA